MSDPNTKGPDEGLLPASMTRQVNLQSILDMASETVSRESQASTEAIRQLFETRVDVLTDVNAARRLSVRHNDERITDELIDLVLAFIDGKGDKAQAFKAIDDDMRMRAKKRGFFLEHYPTSKMQHRLTDAYTTGRHKYLITETSALKKGQHGAEFVPCADAQFHIPTTGHGAKHVMEMPIEGDDIVNRDLVDRIRSMPYAVASLDDIVCEPAYAGKNLASAALKRGLHEIITVENAERRHQKIQYVTACLASIQGVELENGFVWRFQEDGNIAPIFNDRSAELFEHMRSPLCSAFRTAFVLRERNVAVHNHPRVKSLLVDWHTKIASLKEPTQ